MKYKYKNACAIAIPEVAPETDTKFVGFKVAMQFKFSREKNLNNVMATIPQLYNKSDNLADPADPVIFDFYSHDARGNRTCLYNLDGEGAPVKYICDETAPCSVLILASKKNFKGAKFEAKRIYKLLHHTIKKFNKASL